MKLSGTQLRLLRRLVDGVPLTSGLNVAEQAAMSGTVLSLTRRKLITPKLKITEAGRAAVADDDARREAEDYRDERA